MSKGLGMVLNHGVGQRRALGAGVGAATMLGMLAVLASGCFDPDGSMEIETDDAGSVSTTTATASDGSLSDSDSSTATTSTTGDSMTSSDPSTSSSSTTGETTGDSTDGGSTGDVMVEPMCGDGVVVATEVCYESFLELEGEFFRWGRLEDLDNDGDRDLMYSAGDGELTVQFNAAGSFGLATSSNFAGLGSFTDIGFLNFNGDDVTDALMVSTAGAVIHTASGNTSGNYALTDTQTSEGYDVAMGNMDADADIEAVVVRLNTIEVWDIDSNGDLSMISDVTIGDFATPISVELNDFNGDQQLDVLYRGPFGMDDNSQIRIQLGNGDGTLNATSLTTIMDTTAAQDIVIGDFDPW